MKNKKDNYLKFKDYVLLFEILFFPFVFIIPIELEEKFGSFVGIIGFILIYSIDGLIISYLYKD